MTRRERSSARTWAGTSTVIPLVARRELWPSLAGPTGAKLCVHDHGLAWEIGRDRGPHGQFGTHLSRGAISYIAYRWNGREYRESTRSTERRVAERLLASRVADGRGRGHHGPLTFDHRAVWYLDDYLVRRLRTVDTARGRVANLRATFGGQPATEERRELYRYGHSRRLGHRDGRHRGVSAVVEAPEDRRRDLDEPADPVRPLARRPRPASGVVRCPLPSFVLLCRRRSPGVCLKDSTWPLQQAGQRARSAIHC